MISLRLSVKLFVVGAAFIAASISSADARGFAASNNRGGWASGYNHRGVFGQSGGLGLGNRNGLAGFNARNQTGPYGGRFASAGAGFATPNNGLVGGGFNAAGPNGGVAQGGGLAGWQRGVGGFEGTNMSARGPAGSTYNGFTRGSYNAQTGTGNYDANRQVYDAQNGQNYGWTNQSTYKNGQDVTQIDTDHRGDYTIDWTKGQLPTVVKDPTTGQ